MFIEKIYKVRKMNINMKNLKRGLVIFSILFLGLISYISAATLTSDPTFTSLIVKGSMQCIDNGWNWSDAREDPIQIFESINDCYNPEAFESKSCCPLGYQCVNGTGSTSSGYRRHYCEFTGINYCFQYQTQEECENYTNEVVVNTIEYLGGFCGVQENSASREGTRICWNQSTCKCKWDSDDGNCTAVTNITHPCNTTISNPDPIGSCTWVLDSWEDRCDENGVIIAKFIGNEEGEYPGDCNTDKQMQIPCESIVKLNFFEKYQILIAILTLISIYFLIYNKNEV